MVAGCIGQDASPERPAPLVSATTGAIRGLVVDEAIRPLAAATISVPRLGVVQQTDLDGLFAFGGLAPGLYSIEAEKAGHASVQVLIEVAADVDPPLTRIVLATNPVTQPYVEAYSTDLFLTAATPFYSFGSTVNRALGNASQGAGFFMTRNATVVQLELTWEPNSATAEWAGLAGILKENDEILTGTVVSGPSPLSLRLNGTHEGRVANGFFMRADPAEWRPDTLPPNPAGVLVVNQRYQGFGHAFYNFPPQDGWLFVRDGPHPIPPPTFGVLPGAR